MAKAPQQNDSAKNLLPHSLSDLVPGAMNEDEFNALCTSIKENGLARPITIHEGRILDGRERYRACIRVGVEPRTEPYTGKDAAAFVLAHNLHRRQLNTMQKALVAGRMATGPLSMRMSQRDAAARVGCSHTYVNLAVRLLESRNSMLIKRCERGDITRTELEEQLYERSEPAPRTQSPSAAMSKGADHEDDDDVLGDGPSSGNVVDLKTRMPSVGTKPSRSGKVAVETPASRLATTFKALSEAERKNFVEISWTWLEPAVVAVGKLAVIPAAANDSRKKTAAR
jgi:ParB/RepB/Spo0J family partition protein